MIDTVHWRRAKVFAFEHDLKLSELLGDALDYYIRHRGAYVLGRKIGSDLFPKTPLDVREEHAEHKSAQSDCSKVE